MALFPFYRRHFFDDPFFFNRLDFYDPFFFNRFDFYDPWYDFDMFPMSLPITPRIRRVKQQERLTYSSSSKTNSTESSERTSRSPRIEKFPVQQNRLQQAKDNNQSLAPFGQYRDSLFDDTGFRDGSDIQPRIVDKGNNQKQLEMSVEVKNFRPEEIKVSVENNELIVQGEHQYNDANRSERSSFFRSTTLPRGTQVNQLESRFNDGQLKIEAPVF